jgi:hypothetical protein
VSAGTGAGELGATGRVVETMIPRRLDRLPWSRWHLLIVIGLGVTDPQLVPGLPPGRGGTTAPARGPGRRPPIAGGACALSRALCKSHSVPSRPISIEIGGAE